MEEEIKWRYIPAALYRCDLYENDSERSLILSLCSPHEKVITIAILDKDAATALRDAINKLFDE